MNNGGKNTKVRRWKVPITRSQTVFIQKYDDFRSSLNTTNDVHQSAEMLDIQMSPLYPNVLTRSSLQDHTAHGFGTTHEETNKSSHQVLGTLDYKMHLRSAKNIHADIDRSCMTPSKDSTSFSNNNKPSTSKSSFYDDINRQIQSSGDTNLKNNSKESIELNKGTASIFNHSAASAMPFGKVNIQNHSTADTNLKPNSKESIELNKDTASVFNSPAASVVPAENSNLQIHSIADNNLNPNFTDSIGFKGTPSVFNNPAASVVSNENSNLQILSPAGPSHKPNFTESFGLHKSTASVFKNAASNVMPTENNNLKIGSSADTNPKHNFMESMGLKKDTSSAFKNAAANVLNSTLGHNESSKYGFNNPAVNVLNAKSPTENPTVQYQSTEDSTNLKHNFTRPLGLYKEDTASGFNKPTTSSGLNAKSLTENSNLQALSSDENVSTRSCMKPLGAEPAKTIFGNPLPNNSNANVPNEEMKIKICPTESSKPKFVFPFESTSSNNFSSPLPNISNENVPNEDMKNKICPTESTKPKIVFPFESTSSNNFSSPLPNISNANVPNEDMKNKICPTESTKPKFVFPFERTSSTDFAKDSSAKSKTDQANTKVVTLCGDNKNSINTTAAKDIQVKQTLGHVDDGCLQIPDGSKKNESPDGIFSSVVGKLMWSVGAFKCYVQDVFNIQNLCAAVSKTKSRIFFLK